MNEKLRKLRKDRGVSISFMAKKLGYKHPSGYANIEYGKNKLKVEHVKTVADVLGVTVEELIS